MEVVDMELRLAELQREMKAEIRIAMADAYRETIKAILETEREHTQTMITQAMVNARCDCPLDCMQHGDVRHFVGIVKDLGDGDVSGGLRKIRENHIWAARIKRTSDTIASTSLVVAIGVAITALIGAFGLAIRFLINAGPK